MYYLKSAWSQAARNKTSYKDAVAICEASNGSLGVLEGSTHETQGSVWTNIVKKTYKEWRKVGETHESKIIYLA